jgi:hypothetical protein
MSFAENKKKVLAGKSMQDKITGILIMALTAFLWSIAGGIVIIAAVTAVSIISERRNIQLA